MDENKQITAAEITQELIEQQAAEYKAAVAKASDAAQAYLEDVEQCGAELKKQAQLYQDSLDKLAAQRKQLAGQVADLASRGQIDAAEKLEVKIEELDSQTAAYSRKLRIVNNAEIKGDRALYQAAKDAHTIQAAHREPYVDKLSALQQIVTAEMERLHKLNKQLTSCKGFNPGLASGQAFEKVDRHFRELDHIEREAREKWEAEQEAGKQKQKGRRHAQVCVPPR